MTRIEVMHGINLDQLGRRPVGHYGAFMLSELETRIGGWAAERGMEARFYRTNFEGEWVEHLHKIRGDADGLILNPGAWTHYAWAIRDALEIAALPAVEVHLSDVMAREPWRQLSVIRDLCVGTVSGQGPEGYREALDLLREHLP